MKQEMNVSDKKRTRRIWILSGIGLLVLISLLPAFKRIRSIDFTGIYGNAHPYHANVNTRFVIRTDEYPDVGRSETGLMYAPNGSVQLDCMLDDYRTIPDPNPLNHINTNALDPDTAFMLRSLPKLIPTAHPIGERSFFVERRTPYDHSKLVYYRYNLQIEFKSNAPDPQTESDAKELGALAEKLDAAILRKDPSINIETVRIYQWVWHKVYTFIGGIFFVCIVAISRLLGGGTFSW
jgi:hypothetical protein